MENFHLYEEAIYKIDKSREYLQDGQEQESARNIVEAYKSIDDTEISNDTNLRAYVESIVGSIRSGKNSDSIKYMIELRDEISRFQKEQLSSLNTA